MKKRYWKNLRKVIRKGLVSSFKLLADDLTSKRLPGRVTYEGHSLIDMTGAAVEGWQLDSSLSVDLSLLYHHLDQQVQHENECKWAEALQDEFMSGELLYKGRGFKAPFRLI